MTPARMREEFEREGRCWIRGALSERDLGVFDAAADLDGKAG